MAGPAWLPDTFAAVLVLIAGYCAVRLAVAAARRRETEADTDGMHLVMGAVMAGMLAPGLRFGTPAAWTVVFAVAAAWFAWQALRVRRGLGTGRWCCPYPLPHLAESLAMVYMTAAARTPAGPRAAAGMAGMSGAAGAARVPELALLFTVFTVGYVAWLGDRFSSLGAAAPAPTVATAANAATGAAAHTGGCWPDLAPRGACCYQIAMAIVMAYMLVVML